MPKRVTVEVESISPYSASRQHHTPKKDKERPDEYEARTWREKCTTTDAGEVAIPAMAFKMALDRCAKVLGTQVPGKGKATFTKHFVGGVLCESDVPLGVTKDAVASVTINANADGVRGSGKRVQRIFPMVSSWKSRVSFFVLDDAVTREVFEKHFREAGQFVGVGRFRPENGGLNGRFRPVKFVWEDL